MSEKNLENRIKNHLKTHKHYYFKVSASGTMRAGIPDIIACIEGIFVGIEVKNPNKKGIVSKLQEYHIESIKQAGGMACVVDDYKKYLDFYEEVLCSIKNKKKY